MRIKLLIVLLALFQLGCNQQAKQHQENSNTAEIDVYENVIPELKDCIEAHGGLSTWKGFGGLAYDRLSSSNAGDHSIIDLYSRKDLVSNDTAYTIGFDGSNVWITPNMDKMKSPRFFHNLYFYFLALPFVVADPGSNQEYLGLVDFDGKSYKKVRITYGDSVGDSPEDQYVLWIDAQTNLLGFINYSVTYFDKSRAANYNAAVYSDWQEVQGLKMPTVLSFFRWADDSLGESRGDNVFSNMRFTKEQPDQSIFEAPEDAVLDVLTESDTE